MDQRTRQALKQDKFVNTTTHGLEWAGEHRKPVILWGSIAVVVIVAIVIGFVIYGNREDAASAAFGAAMQVYQTPLAQADQPSPEGVKTFPTVAARAKAANQQFMEVANKYSMEPDGRNALYFAGLTYMDEGEMQNAEDTLKKVAGSWDKNLAALAKLALAQIYHDTGRDTQAIAMYNELSAKPTTTVPYGLAQLQLASLYETEGNTQKAKDIYASLKDKDAKGPAGEIASQKLNPAPAMPHLGGAQ